MDIVERVKIEVLNRIEEYKNNFEDNYDFWNEHVKYVYEESIKLAEIMMQILKSLHWERYFMILL